MVLAAPLARQIGGTDAAVSGARQQPGAALVAGVLMVLVAATVTYASVQRYAPNTHGSPVVAVAELKKLESCARVQRLRFRRLPDRKRGADLH